jgi:DegV family protein with EDD domain
MGRVKVVIDSACDLPDDVAESLAVDVVPLTVRFGSEELPAAGDAPACFWERWRRGGEEPKTASPPPGAFLAAFSRARSEGCDGVVCITISERLSSTFSSARLAAEHARGLVPVRVVDSQSVSMGEGLLALEAAAAVCSGKALGEIAEELALLRRRIRVYAALESFDALSRRGRIGGAGAMVGSLLSIKPVIAVREGTVQEESRQRTRSRSLEYLAAKVKGSAPLERLVVVHGDAPDVGEFVSEVAPAVPGGNPIVASIGPVIGSHTGPGAIGVAFLAKA